MAARSSGWLLLSLAALSVLLVAERHYGVGRGVGRPSAAAAQAPLEAAPAPVFALADRETFSETLTRPLFMPGRQPAAEEGVSVEEAPVAMAARPDAGRYVLSAVIIVDDERIALLSDTATGDLRRVREGEDLAGWRVEEIHDDSAVLKNGDTREELSLRTFAPPPPVPAAPRNKSAPLPGADKAPPRPPAGFRRPRQAPRQPLPVPRAPTG